MDHILSELSSMTHPSWVALRGMAHGVIELDKPVVHVISLISFLRFSVVAFLVWEHRLSSCGARA